MPSDTCIDNCHGTCTTLKSMGESGGERNGSPLAKGIEWCIEDHLQMEPQLFLPSSPLNED